MTESFLFLLTGIVGVVTIGLMATSYKSNPFCNVFLLIIISLVSYRFLAHGSYELELQSFIRSDKGYSSMLFLVIVPCFYLYYKHLALPKLNYSFTSLKHFAFIIFMHVINANEAIQNSFIFYYGNITNFILLLGFIIFYVILIYRVLKKHIWQNTEIPIDITHYQLVKKWTIYLFAQNVLAATCVIVSIVLEFLSNDVISGKSLAIVILFSWLFVYFKLLISPEILYGLPILNKRLLRFNIMTTIKKAPIEDLSDNWILEVNSEKSNQDLKLQEKITSNIVKYVEEVEKLNLTTHIFRDPKVSQSDVAKRLGVPTSHIVYLFKYHSRISFSEYRMQSRIKDAIELMQGGFLEVNTLESLAYKTGFSSYNPFFSAFKKVTKCSPQDYLKQHLSVA